MPTALLRFLLLGLPLLLLALGIFHHGAELAGLRVPRLPGGFLLGLWLLESIGLLALFLLVRERRIGRWMAGVATGWLAWIFRGPVLALSSGGATSPGLVLAWLALYTVCGLLLASLAGGPAGTGDSP